MSDDLQGIDLAGTQVDRTDLDPIAAALTEAGISFTHLGTRNNRLHTFDAEGMPTPLPDSALAVIQAFVPPPPPPTKNEILGLMLEGVDPADGDTEILWIVLQESLRP